MTDTVEVRKPDDPREPAARNTDGTFARLTDPRATCGIIQARLNLCESAHAITETAMRLATIPVSETTDSTDELLKQANNLLNQAEELVQRTVIYQRQRKATWHSIGETLGTKAESAQRRYGKAEQDAKDRIAKGALRTMEEEQNQLAANLDSQHSINKKDAVQNGVKRLRFLATLDVLRIEAESREKDLKDLHQAEQLQRIYEHLATLCRELFFLDRNATKWSDDADAMNDRAHELRSYIREQSMKPPS
ncbi:hypothetical protein [Streptosporangium sp. 'caverna']|uniref:hypothetical protein n=1 Tax=Streptosporangium sp. 'caverna' TaxID=2202249 RepID=UPI001EF81DBA|nr:hypothetical protein [Streptosporangium sp. 'caverna']